MGWPKATRCFLFADETALNMISDYALAFLAAMSVVTYILELWTGIAVAGWAGDKSLIERATKPGPYWFVMVLQAAIVFGIATLMELSQ